MRPSWVRRVWFWVWLEQLWTHIGCGSCGFGNTCPTAEQFCVYLVWFWVWLEQLWSHIERDLWGFWCCEAVLGVTCMVLGVTWTTTKPYWLWLVWFWVWLDKLRSNCVCTLCGFGCYLGNYDTALGVTRGAFGVTWMNNYEAVLGATCVVLGVTWTTMDPYWLWLVWFCHKRSGRPRICFCSLNGSKYISNQAQTHVCAVPP